MKELEEFNKINQNYRLDYIHASLRVILGLFILKTFQDPIWKYYMITEDGSKVI